MYASWKYIYKGNRMINRYSRKTSHSLSLDTLSIYQLNQDSMFIDQKQSVRLSAISQQGFQQMQHEINIFKPFSIKR